MGIRSIYDNIASVNITVDGKIPTPYKPDELPNSVERARTPCRLLLPVHSGAGAGGQFAFVSLGRLGSVTWNIVDLMIWKPAAQGTGIANVAGVLIDYAEAYITALQSVRGIAPQSSINTIAVAPGVYEWPMSSGQYYYGVRCEVSVTEVLS